MKPVPAGTRKLKAVYLAAAQRIASGQSHHSCTAVDLAAGWKPGQQKTAATRLYQQVMDARVYRAGADRMYQSYAHQPLLVADFEGYDYPSADYEEARNHRVVALCFMAAIAESGDLPQIQEEA